jgi:hypothetical protein
MRFEVLYKRMRAAVCADMAELQGLNKCENRRCFMFRPVSSVLELDDMQGFGIEHQQEGIFDVGFSDAPRNHVEIVRRRVRGVL